jgi:ATP/maltotriose-dependent transcriptional regulator MalT
MEPGYGIVGRDPELERLDSALENLDQGHAGVLELVGEPGIGKTRLIGELSRRAEARGHLVLTGLAAEFERDLPFGLLIDALDGYLAALPAHKIERLGGGMTGELAAIFPSLHEYTEAAAPRLQDERFRAHRAIRGLLEALAATGPMVLALDDLHWADDASLEAVASLLRRPPAASVLIALAYRSGQEPELLAGTQRAAEQGGWLERIDLGPLGDGAAGELLATIADPELTAEVLRESGGNPFYLTELARNAAQPGSAPGGDGHRVAAAMAGPADVPGVVSAALETELRDLDDATTAFLRAAAVAGEPFEIDLAAEIAELPQTEALETLDRLLERGVIRSTDVPRRFLFRHPLVRRAVYETAPQGWRLTAHGRAAAALAKRNASAAERAHHVEYAATAGDAAAIDLLIEAADNASARAPGSAVRWLTAALRLIPEQGPLAERRPELLVKLATSQAARGQLVESAETISRLLELIPDESGPLRMRLIAARAAIGNLLGEYEDARASLLEHQPKLAAGGEEAAALQIELALNALWTMDYEDAVTWADRAAACAAPLDDRPLRAAASGILAWTQILQARGEAAGRACDAAAALVDELTDDELATRLDCFSSLGWAEYMLGRYESCFAHLERGKAIARASGQGQYLELLSQPLVVCLATLGRLPEAREQSQASVETARLARNPQGLTYALAITCWWASLEGNLEDAERAATEALELTDRLEGNLVKLVAAGGLAEYYLLAGDPERAANVMVSSCGDAQLSRLAPGWHAMYLEILTRAELGADRLEKADAAAGRAEAAAGVLDTEIAEAHARRARGAVLLFAGEPAAAAETALRAAEAQGQESARFDAARSRFLAGRALAAAGERERALEELTTSELEFAACGASRLRDQAARELRRLGKRVGAAPKRAGDPGASGLASLTGRELEVAGLVADRKTNREIAEELVLSEKTIESHLRNVFAKLGVGSRVEVARAVETHGEKFRG